MKWLAGIGILGLLTVFGCGGQQQETAGPTAQPANDTTASPTTTGNGSEPQQQASPDTASPAVHQFGKVAWVHHPQSLPTYAEPKISAGITGYVTAGAMVQLDAWPQPDSLLDTISLEGIFGRMVKVNTANEGSFYVHSGYLLPWSPYGTPNDFRNSLVDPDTLHYHTEPSGELPEVMNEEVQIRYANGIIYEMSTYYEGSDESMTIPGISFSQGYLLVREMAKSKNLGYSLDANWMALFGDSVPSQSWQRTDSIDTYHDRYVTVVARGGRPVRISLAVGDGCEEWVGISLNKNGQLVLGLSAGC